MKPDELVTLLSNDLVQNAFLKLFKPVIDLTIAELLKTVQAKFDIKLNEVSASVRILENELTAKSSIISGLEVANTELQDKLAKSNLKIDYLDQLDRRDNLLITGIPLTYVESVQASLPAARRDTEDSEATMGRVLELFNDQLGVTVDPSDISMVHRLKTSRKAAKGSLPLVLVRFVRRSVRDSVYRAKKLLKDVNVGKSKSHQIFINEDLVDANRQLFFSARHKFRNGQLQAVWSTGCRIHVKTLTGAFITVDTMDQLNSL